MRGAAAITLLLVSATMQVATRNNKFYVIKHFAENYLFQVIFNKNKNKC